MIDKSRDEKQRAFVDKWAQNGARGTLFAVTGFGKSRVGHLAIELMLDRGPSRATLIIVPSTDLYNDWTRDIKELGLNNVKVMTIQSLIRVQGKIHAHLLILDEIWMYTADKFSLVYNIVNYNWVLGLSAPIDVNDEKFKIIRERAPVLDIVTLEEARGKGWVSEHNLYNYGIELYPHNRKYYEELSDKYNKYFSMFNHDWDTAMGCLSGTNVRVGAKYVSQQQVEAMTKRLDLDDIIPDRKGNYLRVNNKGWLYYKLDLCKVFARNIGQDEKVVKIGARQWMNNMQKRKKFLYNSEEKLDVAVELVNKFPEKTITFSQSTDFADKLTERLNGISVAYHSSLETQLINGKKFGAKRLRDRALDQFANDDNIRIINTAKALDVGKNIPDLEQGILCSGTSSALQKLQRIGRNIRKHGDKISRIIMIYIKDTQDEVWNRSSSKGLKHIKQVRSINEIT